GNELRDRIGAVTGSWILSSAPDAANAVGVRPRVLEPHPPAAHHERDLGEQQRDQERDLEGARYERMTCMTGALHRTLLNGRPFVGDRSLSAFASQLGADLDV